MLASTFRINHFDLFGLRQVWLYLISTAHEPIGFRTFGLHRMVRRPLYLGGLLAFWSTPTMTAAHLLIAVVTTVYIAVTIRLEGRDLIASLGHACRRAYRRRGARHADDRAGVADAQAGRQRTLAR